MIAAGLVGGTGMAMLAAGLADYGSHPTMAALVGGLILGLSPRVPRDENLPRLLDPISR